MNKGIYINIHFYDYVMYMRMHVCAGISRVEPRVIPGVYMSLYALKKSLLIWLFITITPV